MVSLSQLFDFNPVNMAKKHKNRIGGFEAPRNSLELPVESFQGCYTAGEYVPYSCEVNQRMCKSSSFSANASMKKLISDEISKVSNQKKHTPSVVARLMGMDEFPSEPDSRVQPFEQEDIAGIGGAQIQNRGKISNGHARKKSKSSMEKVLHSSHKHAYSHSWSYGTKLGKPRPQLHPQEKELQQFKKDFEAWQASRFLECARVVELGNIPDQWLSHLDLTKEKLAAYDNARKAALEKAESFASDVLKPKTFSGGDLQYYGSKKNSSPPKHMKSYAFRKKSMDREFEELSIMDFDKRSDKSSTPARIVILKPGPENFSSNDESWVSSSGSVEDRDCIEDLLEEVKERLKSELHGKAFRKGSMVRGGGIETPFKEKPLLPNQRARDVRTQVSENFNVDLGRKLLRSESTKSYRSEIRLNSHSPEFIRQDTRQLLSERLRNALNRGNHLDIPNIINRSSRITTFDDTRENLEQARNILNATNGWNHLNDSNYEADAQVRSLRHEFADEERFHEGTSTRNLVRSLSAPVSGTSFGKLLLEDRHILTGAHIRRKHEALERVGMDGKGRKKERFNIREKVSNITYNFTLKGKLFSRKFHSFDLSQRDEFDLMEDVTSGPTVLMNLADRHENHTEVPPSPASVCSSSHEEVWKPADNPSSISTSDLTSVEDQSGGGVFREISSNINELRRQLNQLDHEASEVTTITEEPVEAEVVDLEDESEAYIRDLLVASGLYDGSLEDSFSRGDPFAKHIDDWVFEKVEESYRKPNEKEEGASKNRNNEVSLQRKVLFDLLNEALSRVLIPPKALSRFKRNTVSPPMFRPLQGRMLLEKVWEIIRKHIYPSSDNPFHSLDDMVSHDLGFMPWFDLIDGEVKVVSKELEAQITLELFEEIVKDMQAAKAVMN